MARPKTSYVCGECGAATPQWQGQCPACQSWNTLERAVSSVGGPASRRAALPVGAATSQAVSQVGEDSELRAATGIGELDRVLGGGLVAGSVVLLGGDPGIGKSTLLLQAADSLSKERPVLYASGEESVRQVALRARRLGLDSPTLRLVAETGVERIVAEASAAAAAVLVIDSIQMIYKPDLPAAPGSVTQLRDCCMELVYLAKSAAGLVVFQFEDLIGMTDPVNVPGTSHEHANWQRKVTTDIEDALGRESTLRLFADVRQARAS